MESSRARERPDLPEPPGSSFDRFIGRGGPGVGYGIEIAGYSTCDTIHTDINAAIIQMNVDPSL
jgi:hypothetical protein